MNSIEQLYQQNFNSFSQHHKQLKDNFSTSISSYENTLIKGFKLEKFNTISKYISLLSATQKLVEFKIERRKQNFEINKNLLQLNRIKRNKNRRIFQQKLH